MVNKYALTLEEFRVIIMANDRFNLRTSQNNNNKKNEEIKTVQSISYG